MQFKPSELSALQNPTEEMVRSTQLVTSGGEEEQSAFSMGKAAVVGIASLAAPALSYQRNGSILWAVGAWMIAPIYLTYRGVDYVAKGEL